MSTDSIDPEVPDEPVSSEQAPQDGVPSFPTLEEMAALLPQYEFHDVLGVGGMGAVYLGRQATLDRWVAIKVLPQSASMNEEDANRFIVEARSMAKLTHAHIVAVYDFGQTSQGHLYLVMEHIDGLDLHRLIHRDEVTQARIRSLVPQLCDALQYAHDHDVIHRDIKPANILITSDWQAKIVDFGLARDKNADSSGEVEYGTPDYVAPERLQTGAQVDHRADIFALGVVIHEMFTKRTPMAAGANVGQGVPADYYSTVKRCTMADPVQRFQKCSEIKSFLAIAATTAAAPSSAPVHRPPTHAAPQRPVIRHPIDTGPQESGGAKWGWAAAVVALLALAGWFLTKNRGPEPEAPAVAETQEAEPKKPQEKTTSTQPVETPPVKESTAATSPPPVEPAPPSQMPVAPEATVVTSGPVGPFKVTPGDFSVLKRLTGNSRTVFGSALLPDQRHAIAGGSDLVLRIWDIATGKETKSFRSPIGEISNVIPAADGKRVLIYSLIEDQVCIFDIENGKSESLLKAPSSALSQAIWSPDEKSVYLACSNQDSGVYYWDPAKGAVLQQFADWPRGSQQIFPLSATSTGAGDQMLVLGYSTKPSTSPNAPAGSRMIDRAYAALFSMPDHRLIRELPAYTRTHHRLNLSPDGRTLVGGTTEISVLDLPELTTRSNIAQPRATYCQSSALLAEGRLLIAGYSDGSLRLYETETGTELGSLNLESRTNRIAVSKDEGWLVISGYPLNSKEAKPEDYDLRIVRLPDLTRLGSEKGYLAFASQQLAKLDTVDPELADLRKKLTPADALTSAEAMKARVLDLNAKYAAALRRDAQRASPADQLAMVAEADAIAAGQPMPDPVTDASVAGEMKRFRGIYRAQISQLEASRQQAASALKSALETPIREISNKRSQAGDRLGSARALALLASLDSAPATTLSASSVATAAVTTSTAANTTLNMTAGASGARILQRTGTPGTLIKVDRVVKNYYSSNPPRITNIPPDLGPVLEVACSRYHVIALKPDGTLRSWGTWSDRTTVHTIPESAKDVVAIIATDSCDAALLATGSVVVWSENSNRLWSPPAGTTVTALRKGGSAHNFAICSDGGLHAVTTYSLNSDDAVPSGISDVADATGYYSSGYFAVKKDGTMMHWGKSNIYLGETHTTIKDALAVAEGNGFLAVIHKDGTIDGWGEVYGRQRFRTRKYPGASRILGDPDNRVFFVQRPGNEWAVLPNPAQYDYREEERLSTMEGKLKGCTSVAVAEWVVFGVKP